MQCIAPNQCKALAAQAASYHLIHRDAQRSKAAHTVKRCAAYYLNRHCDTASIGSASTNILSFMKRFYNHSRTHARAARTFFSRKHRRDEATSVFSLIHIHTRPYNRYIRDCKQWIQRYFNPSLTNVCECVCARDGSAGSTERRVYVWVCEANRIAWMNVGQSETTPCYPHIDTALATSSDVWVPPKYAFGN